MYGQCRCLYLHFSPNLQSCLLECAYGQYCCLYQHLCPDLQVVSAVFCILAGFRIPGRAVLFSASDALPGGGIPCLFSATVASLLSLVCCSCGAGGAILSFATPPGFWLCVRVLLVWLPLVSVLSTPCLFSSLALPLVCCWSLWVPPVQLPVSFVFSLLFPLFSGLLRSGFQKLLSGGNPRGFEPWDSHPFLGWRGPSFGRDDLGVLDHGPPWRMLSMALVFPSF